MPIHPGNVELEPIVVLAPRFVRRHGHKLRDLLDTLTAPHVVEHFGAQFLHIVPERDDVCFGAHPTMAGRQDVKVQLLDSFEVLNPVLDITAREVTKSKRARRNHVDDEQHTLGRKAHHDHIVAVAESEIMKFDSFAAERDIEAVFKRNVRNRGRSIFINDVNLGFSLRNDRCCIGEHSLHPRYGRRGRDYRLGT